MRKEKKKEERILAKQSGYCVMMTAVTSTGRGWGSGRSAGLEVSGSQGNMIFKEG